MILNHGSLFSGIGGFDLAAQWMGWNNIFHCEWNEFGQKVLKYYWPDAISYEDISKTDFTIHQGQIDILTGGFPCQPFSHSGKRLGVEDDRHLWPQMLRAIREIQPKWVVGENVLGIVSWNEGMVFDAVQADLETEGYEIQPYVLPAGGVNAPHQRYRVWFVAHANRCNDGRGAGTNEGQSRKEWIQEWDEIRQPVKSNKIFGPTDNTNSHTDCKSLRRRTHEEKGPEKQVRAKDSSARNTKRANDKPNERKSPKRHAANPNGLGRERWAIGRESKKESQSNDQQSEGCNLLHSQGWEEFPTQSPICSGNDGVSPNLDGITFSKWRNESIKAYGNAVVPQVVLQIFKAIAQYEELKLRE